MILNIQPCLMILPTLKRFELPYILLLSGFWPEHLSFSWFRMIFFRNLFFFCLTNFIFSISPLVLLFFLWNLSTLTLYYFLNKTFPWEGNSKIYRMTSWHYSHFIVCNPLFGSSQFRGSTASVLKSFPYKFYRLLLNTAVLPRNWLDPNNGLQTMKWE